MDKILIVFYKNILKIALFFCGSLIKVSILCGTNFELYSCIYFETEGSEW